jgi:hypothetical protein
LSNPTDIHLFPQTDEGAALIYQLQQRAEQWAEAVSHFERLPSLTFQGIMTMVFTSDDFCELTKASPPS